MLESNVVLNKVLLDLLVEIARDKSNTHSKISAKPWIYLRSYIDRETY